jgi:hypothetical protein
VKKRFGFTVLTFIVLFVAMFGAANGMAYYRSCVTDERGMFRVSLSRDAETYPVVVDIAKQGLPKKIFQPGGITVYSGHSGGITNKTSDDLNVLVKYEGFSCPVVFESTDKDFDLSTGELKRTLKLNQAFAMGIELEIPRAQLKQKAVMEGQILFVDADTGGLLATVDATVINSNGSGQG